MMLETDADLPTLIARKQHLNVLRYIRLHQLREPELVLEHGKALLGDDLSKVPRNDELARLAALEQICLAAADTHDSETAQLCLDRLQQAEVSVDSCRFRLLHARCLEADGKFDQADEEYDALLTENPANLAALKRKYCIQKAQVGHEVQAAEALNAYLQQNYADTAAWYELAALRQNMGDWAAAAFCMEEVVLGVPNDSSQHCELAECYLTAGGLENCMLARKHMAQALELDGNNRRAQFGLVVAANAYLEESAKAGKKELDEFEVQVAQELIKYGAEQVLKSYKGTDMFASVKTLMSEYTDS